MKLQSDPRHMARRMALQTLFEWTFLSRDPEKILEKNLNNLNENDRFLENSSNEESHRETEPKVDKNLAVDLVTGVISRREEIDEIINSAAPEWPISQIAKIDLSILRIAIFELLKEKTAPTKVIIDEAVELGKEYGGENSSKFVNGVLGTVVEKMNEQGEPEPKTAKGNRAGILNPKFKALSQIEIKNSQLPTV